MPLSVSNNKKAKKDIIRTLNQMDLPNLGDGSKIFEFGLRETEINAIYAATGFMKSCCLSSGMNKYWEHYGPTLENLSNVLLSK